VVGVFFVGCCPVQAEQSSHKLEDALEGTYTVRYEKLLGHLDLRDGHYLFTPQDGVTIPAGALERFFFVRHTQGAYEIEYLESFNQDTPLGALEDMEYLAYIIFDADEVNENRSPTSERFLVYIVQEQRALCFGSIISEVGGWSISKLWDD
jgi:hypothetical protein